MQAIIWTAPYVTVDILSVTDGAITSFRVERLPSQSCPALRLGERVVLSSPLGRVWNGPRAAWSRGLEEGEVGYSRRRPWESSHTSFLNEKRYSEQSWWCSAVSHFLVDFRHLVVISEKFSSTSFTLKKVWCWHSYLIIRVFFYNVKSKITQQHNGNNHQRHKHSGILWEGPWGRHTGVLVCSFYTIWIFVVLYVWYL